MGWRGLIVALLAVASASAGPVDFDRDIRPIFADRCFACHGPDEKQRMAGFRLDRKDGGAARLVVPGKSEDSRLYQRVSATSRRMPPAAAGRR